MTILNYIQRLDSHHKLYCSLAIAGAVFLTSYGRVAVSAQFMSTWLAYSVSYLLFSWLTILSSHPIEVKKWARLQDSSRLAIFIFVAGVACASFATIILLLESTRHLHGSQLNEYIVLSTTSGVCAWWLFHTVFIFRYAHLYYTICQKNGNTEFLRGLDFPSETEPDYLDFTYFAVVIGMTFQVSDVVITSKKIRRLVLVHGILSFAFNTVIVALTINIVSVLIQR